MVVWVNGHQSEPLNIVRSAHHGCPLLSFQYVLTLNRLFWKLETLRGISHVLGCGRVVLHSKHLNLVSNTVKEYEEVTGVKINPGKSVNLERQIHADWECCRMLDSRTCKIAWALVQTRPPAGEELEQGDKQGSQSHPKMAESMLPWKVRQK